ncbi:MAG: M42 family metallopeptidase, partial [Promethearchaeota archaeon]
MAEESEKKERISISEERKKELFGLAKELTGISAPTGFEDKIRDYLLKRLDGKCLVETDRMGNVIASCSGRGTGKRKKIMLSAHIDEIGFMVSYITKDGFLRIVPLGGQNYRILPGQRVTIFNDNGCFEGVIAEKPIHLLTSEERRNLVKEDEIFVDVGAIDKDDAMEFVSIGDYITFKQQCEWLGQGEIFSCKAADDRMGVLVELLSLERFLEERPEWDVICVFSVQEEIGIRGAKTSAFAVDPDAAIVLEVTHAIDFPGISKDKFGDICLGRGPTIAVGPNLHPKLTKFLMKTAENNNIPIQIEVENRPTGTDAREIQVTRKGVATSLVSIPLRYMHTNIEVVSPVDLHYAIELVTKSVTSLDLD